MQTQVAAHSVLFNGKCSLTDPPAFFDQIHRMPAGCTWQFNPRMRVKKVNMWAAQPYSFQLQYRVQTWWGSDVWRTATETMGSRCFTLCDLVDELNRQRMFQRRIRRHYWRQRRAFVNRLTSDYTDLAQRSALEVR